MTVEDLIKALRQARNGPHRRAATDAVHELERFSLGTEIVVKGDESQLKTGKMKSCNMEQGKLYVEVG